MTIPPITLNTGRKIGKGHPAYIIAEIGSNHDGDLNRAKQLIHAAKKAGADAAKFQSFQVEHLINTKWFKEGKWEKDPSWDTLKRLSIPLDWHNILQREAKQVGIDFISTPFDLERLQSLVEIDVPLIKIASGDLTYFELIEKAGLSTKPVIISSGHATLAEVEGALRVLWKTGCKDIILLHCASLYPSDFKDANLLAMTFMQQGFQVQVGHSDHSPGSVVPLGAVSLGACVIEKHFTDDKTRKGPDHPFALNYEEFAQMVIHIRQLEQALIGGRKEPLAAEEDERIMARRAIYAKTTIPAGTPLEREHVKIVRHAYPEGIPADALTKVMGLKPAVLIEKDALIKWEMF